MSTTHASLLSQSDMPFNAALGCVYVNAFATDEKVNKNMLSVDSFQVPPI